MFKKRPDTITRLHHIILLKKKILIKYLNTQFHQFRPLSVR